MKIERKLQDTGRGVSLFYIYDQRTEDKAKLYKFNYLNRKRTYTAQERINKV